MIQFIRSGSLLAMLAFQAACVQQPIGKDYTAFKAADPHSILIVPVVNHSTQVDAADLFLATLTKPLAERGYYVFPVNMIHRTMDDQGMGDADLVAKADTPHLASLFGAQSVLYCEIERWDTRYIILAASTTVEIHYTLKNAADGKTLWDRDITTVYQPQGVSGGNPLAALVADAIEAAVQRAKPNYIPLAEQANALALTVKDQGVPFGPYDTKHGNFQ